jgi:radical SAM protein with 4Fe4S-binding SPASM domain
MEQFVIKSPINVNIELTSECNQGCEFCYNCWRSGKRPPANAFDIDNLKPVIDKLAEAGIALVTFTGGEPLLREKLLFEIITYARGKGLHVSLNSNAILLTPTISKALKDLGVYGVFVTIVTDDEEEYDSITGREGSLRSIIAGIRNATTAGLRVEVNMPVYQKNKGRVLGVMRLVHSLGVRYMSASRFVPYSGSSEEYARMELGVDDVRLVLEQLMAGERLGIRTRMSIPFPMCAVPDDLLEFYDRSSVGCAAGKYSLAISSDGTIKSCVQISDDHGNILTGSLMDAWKSMEKFQLHEMIPKECRECGSFEHCGGGCRAIADAHGDLAGKDILMTSKKEWVLPTSDAGRVELNGSTVIDVVKPLVIRDESFGSLLIMVPAKTLPINADGTRLVKALVSKGGMTVGEIIREFSIEEPEVGELHSFIRSLINMGVATYDGKERNATKVGFRKI